MFYVGILDNLSRKRLYCKGSVISVSAAETVPRPHRDLSLNLTWDRPNFYRAVNGSAPAYLSSYFTRVADVPSRLRLRSSHSDQVIVLSFNLATVGRRAFPVFAAYLWNSFPAHVTSSPSLTIFRQRLKTFLFQRSYPDLIM